MTQEEEKFKEFSRLNDHYLKISVTSQSLKIIGLNINKLDNILYIFTLTPEEIKQDEKYKNMSLNELYEKIIDLIVKKQYLITSDKNCIVLTIYEGENFDINKDLQFFLIKSNDINNPDYQNALKKIIMSLKRENNTIKDELDDLKMDKKAKSESLSGFGGLEEKTENFLCNPKLAITIQPNQPYPFAAKTNSEQNEKKQNLSASENTFNRDMKRKRSTYGLTISRLSKLDYDSYPSVELSDKSYNVIVGYGGNTYNGIKRKYNEDKLQIIPDYKLTKPVKKKNGEVIDPKISYFAVYDGHGGDQCVEFIKKNLHNYIFTSNFFPLYTMQAIGEAYVKAEQEYFSIAVDVENNKLLDRSGSCAVSALIMDEWCFITNLGDSRALYSYDSGKQLYQVIRDHKPNDPIEKERIEKAGGSVYHDNYVMINGIKTKIEDNQLPPGVSLPYRLLPGNIAVRIYLFFIYKYRLLEVSVILEQKIRLLEEWKIL